MQSISRLTVLLGAPALLMVMVSLAAWLALGSAQNDFGPMRLTPLPPPSASNSPNGVDLPPPNQLEHMSAAEAELKNALLPFSHSGLGSAAAYQANATLAANALECLTQAVYYEAAREPELGQRAVAQVVLNRVASTPFPKTVCGVVQQGVGRPGCQFTFMCDGSLGHAPNTALWLQARTVAQAALNGYVEPAVGDATHYHADYVFPIWAPQMAKLTKIGHHIFYHWRGAALLPPTSDQPPEPPPSPLDAQPNIAAAPLEALPASSEGQPKVDISSAMPTAAQTVGSPAPQVEAEAPPRMEAKPVSAAPASAPRTRRAMPERPLVSNPF